ncbi:MAG: pSer/pThr/pTyr-binding forkhead associated (FHA) protein [Polyangiales bacterium]|jgi:pSer/pThr/pTyr-binding forkhead associated (FHA) protein
MYKLVISDDEGKTTVVPLVRNEITIGRKEGNTIRLTERNVSRKHARLARSDGHFVIHDLESYNGVRINGRRIDQDTRLEAGDKVVIGDYVLALQNEEAAEVGASPQPQAAAVPPARLVMLTPPAPGAEFALPEGAIKIGRAEDLDVWVNHRSISREHAEIRREGNQFHVVDLESANGVRLNNDEVAEATLSPGDELELGQVRFRFVGEGERYSFEADRTIQMDAVDLPSVADPRKRNTLIGVGIVVMAIVVAGLLALTDTERPTPEPVATPIEDTTPPENTNPEDSARRFMAANEACVEALRNEDFVAANAAAEQALLINPDSMMASDCQRRAQGRVGAQQQFEEGVAHLTSGRVEDAWMAFDSLPTDSAFRERPEVEQARTAFVQHYYQAAQTDAENGDRASALRQLDQVFNHSDEESEVYEAAQELKRQLEAQARNIRGPRNMRRTPIRMDTSPVMTPMNTMTTEMQASTRLSAREIMRECNFNNRCVIQRLNREPTTRESLPFLIEAYKAVGNTAAAQRLIGDYLRRYPTGPAASAYRRQVSAQN